MTTEMDSNQSLDEESLKKELDPVLEKLEAKEEDKEKVLQIISKQISFSGPLPPPAVLKEYGRMIRNGEERIMRMAEIQLNHRIAIENYAVREELKQSSRGQIFGFTLGVIGIIGAIFTSISGHDGVAAALAGATIGSLAVAFVIGKKSQSETQK